MSNDQIATEEWYDRTIVDRDGTKIGKVADIYFDHETRKPEWALVHTGMFGTRHTVVPITSVSASGSDLMVPFEKDVVKDAPNVGTDEELSESDEATLAEYYGLQYSKAPSRSGLPTESGGRPQPGTAGAEDEAMTRSEEELRAGTVRRPSELVRLKKSVVTEQQQVTVPVQREEVRIEREPITEANRDKAMSGADITESEHEITLNQEEVVVDKKVVPKERVRLDKDVSTTEETVDETVRKEQVDVERQPKRDS
jgi:uncharacterized protein (TIGR02271 family)